MTDGTGTHEIHLAGREKGTFTGVYEVVAFDEKSVIMETALGTLHIDGSGLSVTGLDLDAGTATVNGRVCGIYYMEAKSSKRRRGRSE